MEKISFLGTDWSLYQMAFYFVIYATVGWFIEVCDMTIELKRFDNRGFLNGPICPIHGFGVVMILMALTPIKDNTFLLFFLSMILCTFLELLVGIGMEKIFHSSWWDYSNKRFNFKGYICLLNSILWGVGCVIVVNVVHPLVAMGVDYIPVTAGKIILAVIYTIIIADAIVSFIAVQHLNIRLRQLEEIGKKLRASSDIIGQNVSDEVLELKKSYDKLTLQRKAFQDRIISAYPNMKSLYYKNALEELKTKIMNRKK